MVWTMSKGFDKSNFDVEFELPQDQVDRLLKEYKKVKRYQKSNLFTIKTLDGTETFVSKMIDEAKDAGF